MAMISRFTNRRSVCGLRYAVSSSIAGLTSAAFCWFYVLITRRYAGLLSGEDGVGEVDCDGSVFLHDAAMGFM